MKEIPILFSTPMVQAILTGRKTQTRRLAEVPVHDHYGTDIMDWGLSKHPYQKEGKWLYNVQSDVDSCNTFELKAKYGQSGDLMWVRETWRYEMGYIGEWPHQEPVGYVYKADEDQYEGKYRPSIHMPKEAARIWLQVTDVRIERLRDISEHGAIAEGVEKRPGTGRSTQFDYKHYAYELSYDVDAKVSFRTLWEKINGADSWQANPWVWVISFKVLSITGKPK